MGADDDDGSKGEDPNLMYRAAGFCLLQGTSSVSLILLNKYLATYFHFPILTLIGQNTIGTLLSILVWYMGIGPTMKPWKREHFVKIVPMGVLFTILLYTSFRSMGIVSIATVVVFRNAGPLMTACGEYFLRGERFSQNSLIALAMMVVGAIVYSFNDLQFDVNGYMWASFNLCMGTAAGLFGKHLAMDLKSEQSGLGLACYQNIVSVPMFVAVGIATGEAWRWGSLTDATSHEAIPNTVVFAGLASSMACACMGVATFELQRCVSQATVAVANVSYKLITLLMGVVIYGNNVGLAGFVGLCIAQISACLYVFERQYGAKTKPADKHDEEVVKSPSSTAGRSNQGEELVPLTQRMGGGTTEPKMKEEV